MGAGRARHRWSHQAGSGLLLRLRKISPSTEPECLPNQMAELWLEAGSGAERGIREARYLPNLRPTKLPTMQLREGTPRLGAGCGGRSLSSGCSGQGFVLSWGELAGLSQRGGAVRGQRQIGSYHNVSGKSTDNMDALKVLLAQRLAPNRPRGARPQVWEGLLPFPSLASLPSKSSGSPSGFHFSS